jgi:hypothetical protein
MTTTPSRRFSLMDAMVLVAATAAGLAGLRCAAGDLAELGAECWESVAVVTAPPDDWSFWGWAMYSSFGLLALFVPFCWAWTLAVAGLSLRQPRPRRRRLASQPGAIACYSAAFALIPALAGVLCLIFMSGSESASDWDTVFSRSFILVPALTGFAVIGSWAPLVIGKRWRAGSTWIDRAGRVLGFYWIGTILLVLWGLG